MEDSSSGERTANSLRLLPELRATHVELISSMAPADVLYLSTNYDLAGRPFSTHARMRQVSPFGMVRAVAQSRAEVLEIWEPLWMRYLALHWACTTAWRIAERPNRRRPIVSFAMENSPLDTLLGAGRAIPGWVSSAARHWLRRYVARRYSRIAFASDGASATYAPVVEDGHPPCVTIHDLPTARSPLTSADTGVVFVGRLEDHKGIRDLMNAWEAVERRLPDSVLTVIGGGTHLELVRRWSAVDPTHRVFLGELEHGEAVTELARHSVLVLPSRPRRRWREQIGLPIREALACGLTVVTTQETGLAEWLRTSGHHIVAAGATTDLARAIIDAISSPIDRSIVQASLPAIDGRVAANKYLTSGCGPEE